MCSISFSVHNNFMGTLTEHSFLMNSDGALFEENSNYPDLDRNLPVVTPNRILDQRCFDSFCEKCLKNKKTELIVF